MAAIGDILQRFRFHGVPGAPAPAGVPVDRVAAIEAELAPVFSLLEAAQQSAAELVEAATADAARRRSEAMGHAQRVLAQARLDSVAARADSAAGRLALVDVRCRALTDDARAEAERIARVAAERTPGLAEELVRRVLALGEPAAPR
jgi:hypothetical protein